MSAVTYLRARLGALGLDSKSSVKVFALQAMDEQPLRNASQTDGAGFLAKACLTIADAFGALDRQAFGWASIKLYYTYFYSVRAWQAYSDEVHVFMGRSPCHLTVRAGERLLPGRGTSHKFALGRFQTRFPSLPCLGQDVEAEAPYDWLRHQRERVQYVEPAFVDPKVPDLFSCWVNGNPRNLLSSYLTVADTSTQYATLFDPEHAMIALPLRMLSDTINEVRLKHRFELSKAQKSHCTRLCRIEGHPVAAFNKLLG